MKINKLRVNEILNSGVICIFSLEYYKNFDKTDSNYILRVINLMKIHITYIEAFILLHLILVLISKKGSEILDKSDLFNSALFVMVHLLVIYLWLNQIII
jgi:hypothetical protein